MKQKASILNLHGKKGKLVNLLVDEERSTLLKELASSMPDVILNDRQICDFELLATGAYSPELMTPMKSRKARNCILIQQT